MNFYGLQKVSLIDYPGIVSCVLFTHGCNFRCPFCHNPELVISKPDPKHKISEKEVLDFLKGRVGILDGVAVTGGEPLIHSDSLSTLFKKLKEMGFEVKLDTNGTFPKELKKMLDEKLVDYVAMDFKCSPEAYSKVGATKEMVKDVLESLEILKSSGVEYEIRATVVEGIHDLEEIKKMAKYLDGVNRFFVQNFVPSETLDPEHMKKKPFSSKELKSFATIISKVVPEVGIRND